jgi:hypothetical protein
LLLACLVLCAGLAAGPPKEEQNKFPREFESRLSAPPINPDEMVNYTQSVQDSFRRLLSTSTEPSRQTTDALANSLV